MSTGIIYGRVSTAEQKLKQALRARQTIRPTKIGAITLGGLTFHEIQGVNRGPQVNEVIVWRFIEHDGRVYGLTLNEEDVIKAKEVDADIIAMSALLTTTLVGQKDLIEALKDQGARDKYKVLVGGGATTREWADTIGADGWAATAYEAVTLSSALVA